MSDAEQPRMKTNRTRKTRTSKPSQPQSLSSDELQSVRGGEDTAPAPAPAEHHGTKRLPTRHYAAY